LSIIIYLYIIDKFLFTEKLKKLSRQKDKTKMNKRKVPIQSKYDIKNILKRANQSIELTKGILKFGSGNIIEDIRNSDSESLGRSDYARELYNEVVDGHFGDLEKIMLRAAAAELAQGGNCHESAALVFVYLMKITNGLRIQICRIKMLENTQDFHVFVRILTENTSPIIVDEWGEKQALTLNQWSDKDREKDIIIIHEEITNESNLLYEKSKEIIVNTKVYIEKNIELLDYYKSINYPNNESMNEENEYELTLKHPLKTNDDLTFLEEDKYIGRRLKRAYNDPVLK
jgi:hypothetical protein